MRILIVSKYGDGAGLAYQMKQEGQQVNLYIKEPHAKRVMDGLVNKVSSIEEGLKNKPDFVLMDMSGMGKLADDIRGKGFKVISGSPMMDKLELDRMHGIKTAKQFGLAVPETLEFSSADQAIEIVKKNPKAWAIKLDNNQGTSSSYVSKDAKEMLDYLAHFKEDHGHGAGILQEKIDGAELSTELWISNGVPVWSSANSTVEDKKFMAGGLGPRTGCETSFVFAYPDERSKILSQTVRPLLPLLKHSRWTGCIDVNCIFSPKDKKGYFLELTPRIGYSAIYGFMAMLGMPISEFFYNIAQGKDFKVRYKSKWGASLKASIPPYPLESDDDRVAEKLYGDTEGIAINGKVSDDFIPIDCEKGKRTALQTSGTSGIVGECLGRGDSLFESWRKAQIVFKALEIPNKQGRYTDGSEDPFKRILQLRNMGFTEIPTPSNGKKETLLGA